jgi:hypothetical protein
MKKLLRIYLFGRPQILFDNQPVKAFPTEKVSLLFAYLVLFRQSAHARATLWGLFCGFSHGEHTWRRRTSIETALAQT